MTKVPPIMINFLLECYVAATPGDNIWEGGWDSPAGLETRAQLIREGYVDTSYNVLPKGERWIKRILSAKTKNKDPLNITVVNENMSSFLHGRFKKFTITDVSVRSIERMSPSQRFPPAEFTLKGFAEIKQ